MQRRIAMFILFIMVFVGLCACGADQPSAEPAGSSTAETTLFIPVTVPQTMAQEITVPETTVPETTTPETQPQTQPAIEHIHSYTSQTQPATCAQNGYTIHTCTDCGHMYTSDLVEPTGHIYEERRTAPSCTEDGYTTFTCTVCGASHEIPEYGTAAHKTTSQVIAPTCTEAGYTLKTCTVCNRQIKEAITKPLGHSYTIHHAVLPGCIQMGYTEHTCDVCGDSYIDGVLDAIGHIWDDWTTVVEPTHTSAGREERKCAACNESQSRTINPLPMTDIQKAQEVLRLVNIERQNAGLNPLSYYYAGQAAADTRAVEIKTVFDHTRPDGRSCFSVLADYSISYRTAGENIALGFTSPEAVVQGWMSSDGHRENILNPNFTMLVVGVRDNGWVQLFLG